MMQTANFNGVQLLNAGSTVTLQVGANQGETLSLLMPDLTAAFVVGGTNLFDDFTTLGAPNLSRIDGALDAISASRAQMGAVQNRLEYTVNALGIYQENLMAAESRIRDVDMAAEMTNLTKLQILQQSGTAMLAQANQSSASVLSLLQG